MIPILCTPFAEDESIDADALASELDFLLGLDIQGVGIGFGSEIPRVADQEREQLLGLVVDQVDGRVPVMVGVGGGSRRAAQLLARAMADAGASLLMVTPPTGGPSTPDELVAYYASIEDAAGRPIVVQDAPSSTGVQMPVPTLVEIARRVESVVALKIESAAPAVKLGLLAQELAGRVGLLGGAGGRDFHHELGRGADGTVPGPPLADVFARIWRLHEEGERDASREAFNRLLPVLELSSRTPDTFLYVQKELLRRAGIFSSSRLRRPCEPLDPLLAGEVDAAVSTLDAAIVNKMIDA